MKGQKQQNEELVFDKGQEWYKLGEQSQALCLICHSQFRTCLLFVLLLLGCLVVCHVTEAPMCNFNENSQSFQSNGVIKECS